MGQAQEVPRVLAVMRGLCQDIFHPEEGAVVAAVQYTKQAEDKQADKNPAVCKMCAWCTKQDPTHHIHIHREYLQWIQQLLLTSSMASTSPSSKNSSCSKTATASEFNSVNKLTCVEVTQHSLNVLCLQIGRSCTGSFKQIFVAWPMIQHKTLHDLCVP